VFEKVKSKALTSNETLSMWQKYLLKGTLTTLSEITDIQNRTKDQEVKNQEVKFRTHHEVYMHWDATIRSAFDILVTIVNPFPSCVAANAHFAINNQIPGQFDLILHGLSLLLNV